jgi:dihydroceramidase
MFATIFRTVYLLRVLAPSKGIPDRVSSQVAKIYSTGAGTFAFGFLVWNLDNIFCDNLTRWKNAIGWPAAFLLEGKPSCFI